MTDTVYSSSASANAAPERFAPILLIAAPGLVDPVFEQTVVLLVESGPDGAYGMVINRPAPVDLGTLLDSTGIPHTEDGPGTVWFGGPVQPQSGLVLYQDEPGLPHYEPDFDLLPGLRMSSSMDLLKEIARGVGPRRFALFLGRASWGAGQLESELSAGAWLPADLEPDLLFPDDPSHTWRDALRQLGADPALVASRPAQA